MYWAGKRSERHVDNRRFRRLGIGGVCTGEPYVVGFASVAHPLHAASVVPREVAVAAAEAATHLGPHRQGLRWKPPRHHARVGREEGGHASSASCVAFLGGGGPRDEAVVSCGNDRRIVLWTGVLAALGAPGSECASASVLHGRKMNRLCVMSDGPRGAPGS